MNIEDKTMISMHKLEEAIKQNTVLWYKEKKRTTSLKPAPQLHYENNLYGM